MENGEVFPRQLACRSPFKSSVGLGKSLAIVFAGPLRIAACFTNESQQYVSGANVFSQLEHSCEVVASCIKPSLFEGNGGPGVEARGIVVPLGDDLVDQVPRCIHVALIGQNERVQQPYPLLLRLEPECTAKVRNRAVVIASIAPYDSATP